MIGLIVLMGMLAGQEVTPAPTPIQVAPPVQLRQVSPPPLPPPPVPDPANPPKVVERPSWARKPTGEAVHRVYPPEALRLAISGRAVVQCQVRLTGRLEGCSVVEETPAGVGFGDAILRLTLDFQMTPLRYDGVPVDGGLVKVPINFSAPPLDAAAPPTEYSVALACIAWNQARLQVLGDKPSRQSLAEAENYAVSLGAAAGKTPAAIAADIALARRSEGVANERLGSIAFQAETCLFKIPVLSIPPVERRSKSELPPPPVLAPQRPVNVEKPSWIRRPAGDAIHARYPRGALSLAISGRAVVQCRVRPSEQVDSCTVVEESPKGLGFGEAALSFTPDFRISAQRVDGVIVDGAWIKVPIDFTAPVEPPFEGKHTVMQALLCVHWHRSRLVFLPEDAESVRGVERFSKLTRDLGVADGMKAEQIERLLTAAPTPSPDAAQAPDELGLSSLCRVAF